MEPVCQMIHNMHMQSCVARQHMRWEEGGHDMLMMACAHVLIRMLYVAHAPTSASLPFENLSDATCYMQKSRHFMRCVLRCVKGYKACTGTPCAKSQHIYLTRR
mmetsp:Transcript_66102/g.131110  ORF Transcript_66102/g.131110 Transcript_66102/m.131110 type:complete len:104 (-) Transcript_66102:189-500(-)